MKLPILISLPHAGLVVPPEVEDLCVLTKKQIVEDGDEGAAEIYGVLKSEAAEFATTDIARTIVDQNRADKDFRKDGVVKTHTCRDAPVYRQELSDELKNIMIEKYHRPYHMQLSRQSARVEAGIDCHTMPAVGPPVSPDPGKRRPAICLSNAHGTCPRKWIESLREILGEKFEQNVSINDPFKGGYIIRRHAEELPWLQIELSQANYLSNSDKSEYLVAALTAWCKTIFSI